MTGAPRVEAGTTDFLSVAILLAADNVQNGGGPFGACVVTRDGLVTYGVNRVTADHDPTAHAEVTALRNAATLLKTHDLSGAVLYTSCAPCPMCLSAALWARVERIVYAATPEDAADAGFDDSTFWRVVARVASNGGPDFTGELSFATVGGQLIVEHVVRPSALMPFEAWVNLPDNSRTEY